jgi:hypothetical protein
MDMMENLYCLSKLNAYPEKREWLVKNLMLQNANQVRATFKMLNFNCRNVIMMELIRFSGLSAHQVDTFLHVGRSV